MLERPLPGPAYPLPVSVAALTPPDSLSVQRQLKLLNSLLRPVRQCQNRDVSGTPIHHPG